MKKNKCVFVNKDEFKLYLKGILLLKEKERCIFVNEAECEEAEKVLENGGEVFFINDGILTGTKAISTKNGYQEVEVEPV